MKDNDKHGSQEGWMGKQTGQGEGGGQLWCAYGAPEGSQGTLGLLGTHFEKHSLVIL